MAKAKRSGQTLAKKSAAKKKVAADEGEEESKVKAKAKKASRRPRPRKQRPRRLQTGAAKPAAPMPAAAEGSAEAETGADDAGTDGGTARRCRPEMPPAMTFRHGTIGDVISPDGAGPSRILGAYQPLKRARAAAVREYSLGQSVRIDVHVLVEHAFEYAAQIERGLKIAVVEQRRAAQGPASPQ